MKKLAEKEWKQVGGGVPWWFFDPPFDAVSPVSPSLFWYKNPTPMA